MKNIRNEQGYTLLVTLVLVTLVVILFSTFTVKALSQQKQVEKTDKTYEVTAIAEMGVEYYQAKVLNAIEVARLETDRLITTFESIVEPTAADEIILKNDIAKVRDNLIFEIVANNKVTTNLASAEKQLDKSNKKFFGLGSKAEIDGNHLTMNVIGGIGEIEAEGSKEKIIKVIFNFPEKLYNIIPAPENDDKNEEVYPGSGDIKQIELISKPIFSQSVITPNFPPIGVEKCLNNYKGGQCFSEGFSSDTKNIKNITIYFTKNNISMPNDKNLQDTTFYFNGNTFINNNLEGIKNATFHVNGNVNYNNLVSIDDNVLIQATGNGNFASNVKIKDSLNIFLQGTATFLEKIEHNTDNNNKKEGLKLFAKEASFKGVDLKNSTFEIDGRLTFNEPAYFKNSQIHSADLVTGKQLDADNSSKFYFDNGLILSSYIKANNGSEVYIKAKSTPVSVDKIDVDNSKFFLDGQIKVIQNGFNIGNKSTVCLKNTNVSNLRMNIKDKNSKVHILGNSSSNFYYNTSYKSAIFYSDETEFNKVCTYPALTETIKPSPPSEAYEPIDTPLDLIESIEYL